MHSRDLTNPEAGSRIASSQETMLAKQPQYLAAEDDVATKRKKQDRPMTLKIKGPPPMRRRPYPHYPKLKEALKARQAHET